MIEIANQILDGLALLNDLGTFRQDFIEPMFTKFQLSN